MHDVWQSKAHAEDNQRLLMSLSVDSHRSVSKAPKASPLSTCSRQFTNIVIRQYCGF